jgi:hypothetical protein
MRLWVHVSRDVFYCLQQWTSNVRNIWLFERNTDQLTSSSSSSSLSLLLLNTGHTDCHCVCVYVNCRTPNGEWQVSVIFRVKDSLVSGMVKIMSIFCFCKEYSWFWGPCACSVDTSYVWIFATFDSARSEGEIHGVAYVTIHLALSVLSLLY